MQRALVHLLTFVVSLAFVASLFGAPAFAAPAKKGGAAFDAARLAMLQVAKPTTRKAEGTRAAGPSVTTDVAAAPPVLASHLVVVPVPTTWTPPALDRSELMVFLI